MMKCAKCGAQYEEDDKFCKHCGYVFEGVQTTVKLHSRILQAFEYITGEDLNHDRVSSMIRQILGLIVIMITIFAVVRKPSPGIFMLYSVPSLLAGVVIVLERRASVGKAIFTLAMMVPYLTIFLFGIPPILSDSIPEALKATDSLKGYFGAITSSVFFIMMGFLFTIFSSIVSSFFNKRLSLISGAIALVLSLLFASSFMGLLGNASQAVNASVTIEDRLVASAKIITTANMPTQGDTINSTTEFKSNEIIYPMVSGLPKDTQFGFRLLSQNGLVIVDFDRSKLAKAKAIGATASGVLNTVENRLPAGKYKLELMVVDGWQTTVSGRVSITLSAEVNPNYGVITDESYAWLSATASGESSTSFKATDEIHLVLDGGKLQADARILMKDQTDKIKLDKKYPALLIGKSDYTLAPKGSDLGTGNFIAVITSTGKEPVTIYFTIN
jgi:hypothetical protein